MKIASIVLVLLLGNIYLGCNLPKDPNKSWNKINTRGYIKVGISGDLPFTIFRNNKAKGTEVELIERFGEENNLDIIYKSGSESQLIEQLNSYNLDVLLGGFDKKTIWKKEVGLSTPYDKEHVMLIPKGENELLYNLERFLLISRK